MPRVASGQRTLSSAMRKIPDYAAHVPFHQLVSMMCGGMCRARRWAQLMAAPPGVPTRLGLPYPGYVAHCLKCGFVSTDNAAWVAP
jgi:hypothetical protein